MKRRSFIRLNSVILAGGIGLNGFKIQAVSPSLLPFFDFTGCDPDKRLVIIQLNGGNDGLNTIIPLDQYALLYNARANVAIPEQQVLKSDTHAEIGFHPAMDKIRRMHNEGKCAIIHGVGYPMPNFSHFRSTDIWMSGSDSDKNVYSGVMGRFLQYEHPEFPVGYPNDDYRDPLAIQIGSSSALLLQGEPYNMGLSIANANNFYQLIDEEVDEAPDTKAGNELTYIRYVAQQTAAYTERIKDVAEIGQNKSTLYPNTVLAEQLKIVARLIAGGSQTKIYLVSLNGFDTHADQIDPNNPTQGVHAGLLYNLSESVNAFMDDIKLNQKEDQVLAMTISEFGRRIASNSSMGTDHGSAAPLFLFGPNLAHTVIEEHPLIPREVHPAESLTMKVDFRSVYATILHKWFCVPESNLENIMLKEFGILPVFDDINTAVLQESPTIEKAYVFPNPCHDDAQVNFYSHGEKVSFLMLSPSGRQLHQIKAMYYPSGNQIVSIPVSNLNTGIYFIQIMGEKTRQTIGFMKGH
jgi:uncharacterized protein (DUF1501 family)